VSFAGSPNVKLKSLIELDSAADAFTTTLNEKLKDNAVKQEQEKHQQMQKSALRAFAALSRLSNPGRSLTFN
jgi:cullin-associated NEDD8-dissociated protein 1